MSNARQALVDLVDRLRAGEIGPPWCYLTFARLDQIAHLVGEQIVDVDEAEEAQEQALRELTYEPLDEGDRL